MDEKAIEARASLAGGHTAGPWHVGDGGHQVCVVYAADGYAVADAKVYHGKHEGEASANARLIAAAPALLGALREVLAVADGPRDEASIMRGLQAIEAARAAIAQAEGRE